MRIKKRSIPSTDDMSHKPKAVSFGSVNNIFPKGEPYYVRRKLGSVEYKAPTICNYWPAQFRRKLLQDYVPPATDLSSSEYINRCTKYTGLVCDKQVSVEYPTTDSDDTWDMVSVFGTVVVDHGSNKQLLLNHDTDAARFLIVLCFLHNIRIPGIPNLHVTEYTGG